MRTKTTTFLLLTAAVLLAATACIGAANESAPGHDTPRIFTDGKDGRAAMVRTD